MPNLHRETEIEPLSVTHKADSDGLRTGTESPGAAILDAVPHQAKEVVVGESHDISPPTGYGVRVDSGRKHVNDTCHITANGERNAREVADLRYAIEVGSSAASTSNTAEGTVARSLCLPNEVGDSRDERDRSTGESDDNHGQSRPLHAYAPCSDRSDSDPRHKCNRGQPPTCGAEIW